MFAMNNINIVRWVSWSVLAIIIIVLGWYFIPQKSEAPVLPLQNAQPLTGTATVAINTADDSKVVFNDVVVKDGTTLFEALKELELRGDISLQYKDYGDNLGIFIEKINGIPSGGATSSWWQYWVNGEYGNVGANTFILKPNDVIEWRFTGAQEEIQTSSDRASTTENEQTL